MKKITVSCIAIMIVLSLLTSGFAGEEKLNQVSQTICPVMEGKINKDIYIDYNLERIYFCCKGCIGEFKKNPEKYIKKLKDQGITLEKAPEPTK